MVIGILQVVNKLSQIFNRVNVVVRRRRNQADTSGGVAHLGNPRKYFAAGQLSAFAGLGALRHFDLQLPSFDQIKTGNPESRGRDLFDRAVF